MLRKFSFLAFLALGLVFRGYSQQNSSIREIHPDPDFISAILQQHNSYRSELQLPPLQWSPALAADAMVWASHLADIDKGQHDADIVGKEGENLWWGTASAFSVKDMVAAWGNEKAYFQEGVFPDCKTRRGAVVGHYTQIVWRSTQAVGCALASNGKTDFLVCRYSPPGNVIGQRPY